MNLLRRASATDLVAARAALSLMTARGTNRQKDLDADFNRLCVTARQEP